ncbi:hypothetical protein [uncultured Prevotella sp.]|uniref:hypothetical protein n=1 Tax=uncultured Prevotella sp. TaxID=159272 RepID=UPI002586D05A|nr:hypothetical protein [uncultured Prevotella sp.]
MLLLRQPDKKQVHFHRRTNGIPTENTPVWEEGRRQLTACLRLWGQILFIFHRGDRLCFIPLACQEIKHLCPHGSGYEALLLRILSIE